MLRSLAIAAALVLLPATESLAQAGRTKNFGISVGLLSDGGAGVGLSYNSSSMLQIRGTVDIDFGQATEMDLTGGVRFYLRQDGPVAAFIEPTVTLNGFGGAGALYISLNGGFGMEYFFNNHLSLGAQLNLGLSLAGGANINLSHSGLQMSIYW